MFTKSDLKFLSIVGCISLIYIVLFMSWKIKTDKYIEELEKEPAVVVDLTLSKPKTKIGDPCTDRNSLTENDLYIDTNGTCVGAKIIKKENEKE